MEVNISHAKAQLSKLISLVLAGEQIVICKNNVPLVDMVPHKPKGKRTLGLLQGKIQLPENLHAPDPDIENMFYSGRPRSR